MEETLSPTELDWQHHEGRDKEGEKFAHDVLVHGCGRVLAKVYHPLSNDEYNFEIAFFFSVPDRNIDANEGQARFMDAASAKVYIENTIRLVRPGWLEPFSGFTAAKDAKITETAAVTP